MQKYIYKPCKTVIKDLGDGFVDLVYKKTPKDAAEAVALALWVVQTHEHIAQGYDSNHQLRVLSDMRLLGSDIPMNREIRTIYQESIEKPYLGKIAVLAPVDTYRQVLIIKVLLLRHKHRIMHFTDEDAAREWLHVS